MARKSTRDGPEGASEDLATTKRRERSVRTPSVNTAPIDEKNEVVPPAEDPQEMPLPSDPKVIFLGGLFVFALLAT